MLGALFSFLSFYRYSICNDKKYSINIKKGSTVELDIKKPGMTLKFQNANYINVTVVTKNNLIAYKQPMNEDISSIDFGSYTGRVYITGQYYTKFTVEAKKEKYSTNEKIKVVVKKNTNGRTSTNVYYYPSSSSNGNNNYYYSNKKYCNSFLLMFITLIVSVFVNIMFLIYFCVSCCKTDNKKKGKRTKKANKKSKQPILDQKDNLENYIPPVQLPIQQPPQQPQPPYSQQTAVYYPQFSVPMQPIQQMTPVSSVPNSHFVPQMVQYAQPLIP